MDHKDDANLEPESAAGTEAVSPLPPAMPEPTPPLPTRRVGQQLPAEVLLRPQAETGAVATIDQAVVEGALSPAERDELDVEVADLPVFEAADAATLPAKGIFSGISRNVFVLGLVSCFTDVASGMIVPLRILFLVAVLQAPLALAGLIEGVAQGTSFLVRLVSERMSARTTRRKPMMILGYSLSSIARPLLAFAGSWYVALGLVFLDRAGNGMRATPREALLTDAVPGGYRSKAFVFHRRMDMLGALLGPLLAFLVLLLTYDDVRAVLAWTAVPGALAVLVLVLFLRERTSATVAVPAPEIPTPAVPASALGKRFWMFTIVSVVFAFGSSTDAFIFLRTADLGDSLLMVPLVYFGFNLVYALLSGPLGALSDRFGRLPVLISGYGAFALIYLGWAVAVEGWNAWVLFLLYGVYAAAIEGVGRAFVADMVPGEARRTALAWFGGLVGLAAIPANLLAGWLWSMLGPSATFTFGAWAALVAFGLALGWVPWLRSTVDPDEAHTSTQDVPAL